MFNCHGPLLSGFFGSVRQLSLGKLPLLISWLGETTRWATTTQPGRMAERAEG